MSIEDVESKDPAVAIQERGDAIEASRRPRIMFDDDVEDQDQRRTRFERRHARARSRSNSISSVRSRVQTTSGYPIEFRTLSFQVSHSQEVSRKAVETEPEHNENLEHFKAIDYHLQSPEKVCEGFNVNPDQGLSQDVAARRLQEHGKNVLPKPSEKYWTKLFFYVFGGFCSILWVGVIIFFICWRPLGDPDPQPYNLGLAILVLIVILLQACFSAFQDWSTKRTLQSILDLLPSDALVRRDGAVNKIKTADIVPGDIVSINIGDKVPADLRLLSTSADIRFDRAVLTGESEEVDGSIDATDDNYLETHNIALMGTIVTNGSAQGVVVVTGAKTAMGAVAKATADVKDKPTLIQREITRFVYIIVGCTCILALLILLTWVGWLRVDHFQFMNVVAMLNDVMGCVVAFIPEGMPVGVALTLMMVARRMKNAKVLPKGLSTVETLGCVNVICSDKTGTLTENRMSVTSIGFVDKVLTSDDVSTDSQSSSALSTIIRASHLCNDSSFDPRSLHLPVAERQVQGNATDGAVLRFAETALPGREVHDAYRKIFQISFNSNAKWMLTMHGTTNPESEKSEKATGEYLVTVKGAPDVLLPKCSSYMSFEDGKEQEMNDAMRQSYRNLQEQLSMKAERAIMLCQRRYTPSAALGSNEFADEINANCLSGLTVVGILGIIDPPRPDVSATVASCRRAGIRFLMVTGDFALTGAAIARQIGIFSGDAKPDTIIDVLSAGKITNDSDEKQAVARSSQSLMLEGSNIAQLEEAHWDLVCQYEEIVFGRTTPDQKLLIVKAFQQRGNAVAVTGDGVNDAPALRAADVGVAIVTGSDVALDAADLVLLDNFDAIIDAIRLGRLVFQNLQKVISYLLPAGSWSEIWPVLLNVFLGVPLPLSSFLMIIICVFTDLFLSLSLIMEKEEFDLLSLPPRNHKRDHLINLKIYAQSYLFIGVMETLCAHSMFFLYMYKYAGIPPSGLFLAFEKYNTDGYYGHTADELAYFNTVGQCVYFVTLVICQWGNILSIRNKRMSILQADPFRKERRNPWLLLSMIISLAIAIFVTEEPGIQSLFGTASVPLEFWFIPLPLALGILIMDELRKLVVRTRPKGWLARIAW